ncbi:MAG: hypothetical protein FWD76_00820 [Firmicutes bacterium]|nr:hypothetical protein [Bacillota bacterium]
MKASTERQPSCIKMTAIATTLNGQAVSQGAIGFSVLKKHHKETKEHQRKPWTKQKYEINQIAQIGYANFEDGLGGAFDHCAE